MSGTFWIDESTAKRYSIGIAFSYGDMNYTKAGATAETFKSLGFKEVQIEARPDDRFYIVSGPGDDGKYNSTPRDHVELVQGYLHQESNTCHDLLQPTDWYVVRKAELGTEVPVKWETWRTQVRDICGQREAAYLATKTTAELETLVKTPAEVPVDPDDYTKGMKPNPEKHLPPYPLDPDQQAELAKQQAPAKTTSRK